MNILSPILLKELKGEMETARNMMGRIPDDKYEWQPHAKSMTIKQLATHLAEIPGWINMVINTDEIDFAAEGGYQPAIIKNTTELLALLEKSYNESCKPLEQVTDEQLLNTHWVMRGGEQIYANFTKYEAIRHSLDQFIHHRAQLGMYLRLLNIPIPGSYGPSADEPSMAFLSE